MEGRAIPAERERAAGSHAALLRGSEHHRYGAVATVAEGCAAIGLSIGGARKAYAHLDPNEDGALLVVGARGALVAVADGHDGAEGAEAALAHLASTWGGDWTGAGDARDAAAWQRAALEALAGANLAVLGAAQEGERAPAPTTLSFALLRPAEDLLLYASIGDSHVFLVDGERAREVGWDSRADGRPRFLGFEPETLEGLRGQCRVACAPAAPLRACVLATDGLSERGIGVPDPGGAALEAVVAAASAEPELRPLEACRALAETALEAHRRQRSGDNVATAVLWLDPDRDPAP